MLFKNRSVQTQADTAKQKHTSHKKQNLKTAPKLVRAIINLFKLAAAVSVLLILFIAICNFVVISSTKKYILDTKDISKIPKADCVLVLGCYVHPGGHMSAMLKDRMDEAISVYGTGAAQNMIVSGDHGKADYDEVNIMKNYAIENDIPSQCIFMDHAGFSTYESMYRADYIFGAKKMIIVTQEYHLYRAVYDARAMGIEAYGVAADRHIYPDQTLRNNIRETAARVKDVIYCIFKPKPSYLGDKIPLSGDGNITNDH